MIPYSERLSIMRRDTKDTGRRDTIIIGYRDVCLGLLLFFSDWNNRAIKNNRGVWSGDQYGEGNILFICTIK